MTINEQQDAIIEEFSVFDDWMDRYTYLIACGTSLPAMNPEYHTDEYLMQGCMSKVWLHLSRRDGRIFMQCDSDSLIVKGILSLYSRLFDGCPVQEIAGATLYFEDKTGIAANMPDRRNTGMGTIVSNIKVFSASVEGV